MEGKHSQQSKQSVWCKTLRRLGSDALKTYIERIYSVPICLKCLSAPPEHLLLGLSVRYFLTYGRGFFPLKVFLKATELDNFSAVFSSSQWWSL